MTREILISGNDYETRVALVEDGYVVEFYVEKPNAQKIAGNVYLGRVINVLPGIQAAFVDIGEGKNAFLYVDDALLASDRHGKRGSGNRKTRRRISINQVLSPGQKVVVQISKEAMGTKGARVTRHVSFPGRYLVLMPSVNYVGVSRRITDDHERQRLRDLASDIKPDNMGVIVRTVAEGKTRAEMRSDLSFVLRLWEKIQEDTKRRKAPSLLHRDLGLVMRMVRDELNQETTRMIVDDSQTYIKILELLDRVAPEMKDRIIYYRDKETSLFSLYGVENAIEQALRRQVWLKSGGYIVIDKTEALTVIDVNTGKFVGTKSLSDTVFKTNMEACEEIMRQLRLRDIGGIIVIDFIDMDKPDHKDKVVEELEKHLKKDHTKTVVIGLTGLGLVEMTRKKVRQSLGASMTTACPYCSGRGVIMSEEMVASKARREIRQTLENSESEAILVEVNPNVASHLIGTGGVNLKQLEKQTGRSIFIKGSKSLHIEDINVIALGTKKEMAERAVPVQSGDVIKVKVEEPHSQNPNDGIARVGGYVIDIRNGGPRVGEKVYVKINSCRRTSAKASIVNARQRRAGIQVSV